MAAANVTVPTGRTGALGNGRGVQALSPGAPQGATMAGGAEIALQWSPEQISGWLKRQFPTDQDMQISHEAIYRSLFVQTRGVLKKELTAHLRTSQIFNSGQNLNR